MGDGDHAEQQCPALPLGINDPAANEVTSWPRPWLWTGFGRKVMPRSYASQFRAMVVEQVRSGRRVAEVAATVDVPEGTLY